MRHSKWAEKTAGRMLQEQGLNGDSGRYEELVQELTELEQFLDDAVTEHEVLMNMDQVPFDPPTEEEPSLPFSDFDDIDFPF